ncbi:MAG TPA: NAD-dependent epimerase/dehydratase family protein, partial [Gemmatimonadaceae bacterium]
MIVAVTGANGFIGRHLCERLTSEGWTVRAGLRRDVQPDAIANLVTGADVVIHAAGATRAPTQRALRDSNVELTRCVASAAVKAHVGRFVFISSQAAAGPSPNRETAITEASPDAPTEAYGRSKRDAELVIRETRDLAHVIVRPAAVYGPRDRDFQALFRLARFGVAVHPGNREQWISLLHVDDAVEGIVRATMAETSAGETYFLANDAPAQWAELFALAAKAAGQQLHVDIEVPSALVKVGAAMGDVVARLSGKAGLLTSDKAALSAPRFWICSNEKARRELGFEPRVGLRDGFAATYAWYRSNGWL